jgi:hypothetical protein
MVSMDIFHSDAFSAIQLTAAVEKIPYRPALLGSLNLFEPDRIRVEWAVIEKRDGTLALIQTSERGAPLAEQTAIKRDIRSFRTVRLAAPPSCRTSAPSVRRPTCRRCSRRSRCGWPGCATIWS